MPEVDPALWAEFQQVSEEVRRLFHQRKGTNQPDAPAAPPILKFTVDVPEEWVMLAFWIARRRADRHGGKNAPTGWPPERIADPDLGRVVLPVVRRYLTWALNEHFLAKLHDIVTGGSALLRPAPASATQRDNRDHVDIIITLGMAKEGFDGIWCEHALSVGYRSSFTEIIQIIGRAARDAPGKEKARFTNLLAEPDAAEALVAEAINDTLKAIAASLLMEQVFAPRFEFTPRNVGPREGFDYGAGGYAKDATNVGFNETSGRLHFEIKAHHATWGAARGGNHAATTTR